ncbi:coiled-coil domain-containing protein 93 [Patella vulgata]|uniref:coiled-coil domain-containing protein 93 n=1 Tax=Patella vulgata TaxID=6465 RepID=UPI0024A83FCE|nr:coiled-coil domain-containing protein 93 [Patella vulgata]
MANPGGSVFAGISSSRLPTQVDTEGREVEVETREDEEQNVKLQETINLLLAAGYFRARIKGLSPFDKVVGGMSWCITTCNFDVDVDLLFQENSTIGQKIALTEKIVAVLPKMKCPQRIEPHQIQGLDFIHIFPVVQWLVKRAIETREEMGDYIRAFSVSQFSKHYKTPEDELFIESKEKSIDAVTTAKNAYKPQRRFRRNASKRMEDEETQVHSTLLEYGRRYGFSKTSKDEKENEASAKKKAVAASLGGKEVDTEEDLQAEEEKRIKMLMSGMSATGIQEGKLSASAVGSIVGMQSAEIQQIASEYAEKQAEIEQIEKSERVGGAQQHKRVTTALRKQIDQQTSRLTEVMAKHSELQKAYTDTQAKLAEVRNKLGPEKWT